MKQNPAAEVSVVIPTYLREQVLLDTIQLVLSQNPAPSEILIVDQTPQHDPDTGRQLSHWDRQGMIRWIRLPKPSIPLAMNHGLQKATKPLVLFLDDDITAGSDLVEAHVLEHENHPDVMAVVGQVLQPGEVPRDVSPTCSRAGLSADLEFPFFSTQGHWIQNVMAGNLSVDREFALAMGGFDENFVGVAYRFETEFARRLLSRGGRIRFCPAASINHLRASRGGTRSEGSHLTSADPRHGLGDYYFAMCSTAHLWQRSRYILCRPFREVCTRFHLKHPWWIPVKLTGELRAMALALRLRSRGPKLLDLYADIREVDSARAA